MNMTILYKSLENNENIVIPLLAAITVSIVVHFLLVFPSMQVPVYHSCGLVNVQFCILLCYLMFCHQCFHIST